MPNVSKRSGGKDIDSFNKEFRRSRLTLTLMYLLVLAVVLFISGGVTRSFFSQRLDDRFHRFNAYLDQRPKPISVMLPLADDVRADLLHVTLIVNTLLLFIAGLLSYWLAGKTLRPIQEAYSKQKHFLSDVSHELRTPLAILQTDLENELETANTQHSRQALQSHLEEVSRMSRLVTSLLMLSRLDGGQAGTLETKDEVVDLQLVLHKTIDRLTPLAQKHQITLSFFPSTSVEIPIATSKEFLEQAITNVIHNAIQYNKKDGRVDVCVSTQEDTATIVVKDTGIGIAQEDLQKVFDRFYRVEKSRSRQTGGSGLGLSIVQSIISSLGGVISLSSQLNEGTTVRIVLPIHKL
ncbi:ATP-binding protein [Candidatus Uhrbacteria bacterium]|nr:ATP-binding protein [Candidatus Uhrbacteria bacterium]